MTPRQDRNYSTLGFSRELFLQADDDKAPNANFCTLGALGGFLLPWA